MGIGIVSFIVFINRVNGASQICKLTIYLSRKGSSKFFVEYDFPIPAVMNPIDLMDEKRKSNFSRLFPTVSLGENSARMEVELSHALGNLMSEGFLEKATPGGGGEYTVTKLGYDYYDQKLADY